MSDSKQINKKDINFHVVFVLGGPGQGKGTQCEKITSQYRGWQTVSQGDCLREEKSNKDSEYYQVINDKIKQGEIVPSEITVKLLLNKMEDLGKRKYLIDGFPRNKENIDTWTKYQGNRSTVQGVLYFDISKDDMIQRVQKRKEEQEKKDDKAQKRDDDDVEVLMKRFETNQKECEPLVEEFRKQKIVQDINQGQDVNQVFREVKQQILRYEKNIPRIKREQKFDGQFFDVDPSFKRINQKQILIDCEKGVKQDMLVEMNLLPRLDPKYQAKKSQDETFVLLTFQDKTGKMRQTLKQSIQEEKYPQLMKDDQKNSCFQLQNQMIKMINKQYLKIDFDRWSQINAVQQEDQPLTLQECKLDKDHSATEWEKQDDEEGQDNNNQFQPDGRGKGKGKGKGKKGKGKGKKGKGKGKGGRRFDRQKGYDQKQA